MRTISIRLVRFGGMLKTAPPPHLQGYLPTQCGNVCSALFPKPPLLVRLVARRAVDDLLGPSAHQCHVGHAYCGFKCYVIYEFYLFFCCLGVNYCRTILKRSISSTLFFLQSIFLIPSAFETFTKDFSKNQCFLFKNCKSYILAFSVTVFWLLFLFWESSVYEKINCMFLRFWVCNFWLADSSIERLLVFSLKLNRILYRRTLQVKKTRHN